MPDHDTISSERLDRCDNIRAKQALKSSQLALAFQHKPDDGTFNRWLSAPHGPDRSQWPVPRGAESQTDALPLTAR
jgi:hypothetical protein